MASDGLRSAQREFGPQSQPGAGADSAHEPPFGLRCPLVAFAQFGAQPIARATPEDQVDVERLWTIVTLDSRAFFGGGRNLSLI